MLDTMHKILDFMSTSLGILVVAILWLLVLGIIVIGVDFLIGAILDRNPEEEDE